MKLLELRYTWRVTVRRLLLLRYWLWMVGLTDLLDQLPPFTT